MIETGVGFSIDLSGAMTTPLEDKEEVLGLPPSQLRHYRERVDVHNGANAFVADQAKNIETQLNHLYAGTCRAGVYFERVHALDADAAEQPCIYMPENPNGLAQISVGFTARVRYYAADDIVTGVLITGTDQGFVVGQRAGWLQAVVLGTDASILRKGQSVALRLKHAHHGHGFPPGVAGEVLSARGAPTYRVESEEKLSADAVQALAPALARARAAAAWIEEHRSEERVAQFIAMYGAPVQDKKNSRAFDLAEVAEGRAPVPAGAWQANGVAGTAAHAAAPRDEPRQLPPERAVGELVVEWARLCETVRALSVEFADAARFADHSNVWRATANA